MDTRTIDPMAKGVGVAPAATANLHLIRPTNRERVRNTNQGAQALLNDIGNGQNSNPKVTSFLKSVEELTKDLLSTPLNDWQDELGALRRDIQGIKAAIEQSSKQTVESFAKMAAKAPAPIHFLSSQSSGSEPALPMEVTRDREVVLCLGYRAQNSTFRRLTPAELTKRGILQEGHAKMPLQLNNLFPSKSTEFYGRGSGRGKKLADRIRD